MDITLKGTPGTPVLRSKKNFETQYKPLEVVTGVCAVVFILGPLLVRRGVNQGLIRCSIMLTTFSLWLFWATIYISQMNPLMGPRLDNASLAWVGYSWGNDPKDLSGSGGAPGPAPEPEPSGDAEVL